MKPSRFDIARWKKIDAVFEAVLERPASERAAFLADSCGDDDELREEVEALLRALDDADKGFENTVSALDSSVVTTRQRKQNGDRYVGPFRLLGELGRGGMGVVYLAEDERLGRKVALKALPPLLGVDEESKRRFVSEARAVSALDHRNIATLYEINVSEEGQFYMVFAYYEGETLRQRISRGPLLVSDALEIATDLAAALSAAHERGIIHRDIKPSNVLLTTDGQVKLLDFGVAKVAGERITRDGSRPGTVAYMSPEQEGGGEVDHRTDLWSLGVVVYEMVTGRLPFEGRNRAALLNAILNEDAGPIARVRPGVAQEVDLIVAKLLSRQPDGRYERADDLAADLQ
ncbi:MAG: serine/threonine protein kinase, partial [Rhodothermales bacterium]|nr:serine/threonine protein kinase [Rhodothermales bacterium]